jgi:hypothetical protein
MVKSVCLLRAILWEGCGVVVNGCGCDLLHGDRLGPLVCDAGDVDYWSHYCRHPLIAAWRARARHTLQGC